ncbi:hypothetical protein [Acinetobacter nosocomialis]|uniref:hypothetical protein n=1 Tax=Acinetobacter nosocomialis TaxID=106654 RepID=UPI00148F3727|nr:hypothetical protein [Acinetobacter nosocomialis]
MGKAGWKKLKNNLKRQHNRFKKSGYLFLDFEVGKSLQKPLFYEKLENNRKKLNSTCFKTL